MLDKHDIERIDNNTISLNNGDIPAAINTNTVHNPILQTPENPIDWTLPRSVFEKPIIQTKKFVFHFSENPETTASNGQLIKFRDYLDSAITAFDLKPRDYFSVFYLLTREAEGLDVHSDAIVSEIRNFWNFVEEKYGR